MVKLLLIFLLSGVCVYGQSTNEDSWNTFRGDYYMLQYPSSWELNKSGQMGTSFIVFSPIENAEDKFKENVNLIIQNIAGLSMDLDKFVALSEEQVKTLMPNSKLFESTRKNSKNHEFHKMIYSGDQNGFHLKFVQYFWVIHDQAFILTFTSEQSKFSDFKDIGEKILESFSFTR